MEGFSDNITIEHQDDKRLISCKITVCVFKEGKHYIHYVPSLNISAYGDTEFGSYRMLKESLDDYMRTLTDISEQELNQELSELGWVSKSNKQFSNTAYVDEEGKLNGVQLPEVVEFLTNKEITA